MTTINTIVAALSSTVINVTGEYRVEVGISVPNSLEGIPHYVGHPDTAAVLNRLGAVAQPKGSMFGGLEIGQSFVAVPLQNPDRSGGWTVDQALASVDQLRVTLVTRIA